MAQLQMVNRTTGPMQWMTLPFDPHEVRAHRALGCPIYDQCLTRCAIEDWDGFTCFFCNMMPLYGEGKDS